MKPPVRQLLVAMIAAIDTNDSDAYWDAFGLLLVAHQKVIDEVLKDAK